VPEKRSLTITYMSGASEWPSGSVANRTVHTKRDGHLESLMRESRHVRHRSPSTYLVSMVKVPGLSVACFSKACQGVASRPRTSSR
jgi:hypothetical protein